MQRPRDRKEPRLGEGQMEGQCAWRAVKKSANWKEVSSKRRHELNMEILRAKVRGSDFVLSETGALEVFKQG